MTSYLTYMLGNNLYVPLTSRCNTRTLPETRGPNFLLPTHIVSALLRVRDLEYGTDIWTTAHNNNRNLNKEEEGSSRTSLPDVTPEMKFSCSSPITSQLPSTDEWLPKMRDIRNEIQDRIRQQQQQQTTTNAIDAIVFGGEGEPTLRLDDMLHLIETLRRDSDGAPLPPFRLTTNGLVASPEDAARRLADGGVSSVSVALATGDADQYDDIMVPVPHSARGSEGAGRGSAHAQVCGFVRRAVAAGLEVEITAVDREDVDRGKLRELVRSTMPSCTIRWRPYFG